MYLTDRIIPTLGFSCMALVVLYVGLMISTIFFASWESQAVSSIGSIQSNIGNLETTYYTETNKLSNINPSSVGFVEPTDVQYVAEANDTSAGLSFAGN